MKYRQNTKGDILYGPPVSCNSSTSVHFDDIRFQSIDCLPIHFRGSNVTD